MIDKIVRSASAAVADIASGASVHVGGFSEPAGCPNELIAALLELAPTNLTVIANDVARGTSYLERLRADAAVRRGAAFDGYLPLPDWFVPVGLLVERGLVRRAITSGAGDLRAAAETAAETLARAGRLEVELVSQGTLAERIRAGRVGVPAFYSPIGVGTETARGKEHRVFGAREYVLETALRADFALIAADKADRFGNLVYRGSARNINPVMAGAASITIAEVNEVVELGAISPDAVHTPGVYVDRVVIRKRGAS